MSLTVALGFLTAVVPFRRRGAPKAAPQPRPRAVAPLPPLQEDASFMPYRDYRPGGYAGDPYRPY